MGHKVFIISSIICFSFVLPVPKAYSQDLADNSPRVKIVSVYVLPGATAFTSQSTSLSDFQMLAPNSKILNKDFSQFYNWQIYEGDGLGTFAPALGIRFNREDGTVNNHFIMRAGLTFSGGQYLSQSNYESTRIPYDTLVSSTTGEVVTRDSIRNRSVSMSYTGSSLQLDVALMWSTDFEARFQVYGGVGMAAGLTFNNYTTISDLSFYYDPDYRYTRNSPKGAYESFRNKSGFYGNIYMPLGLDWRLGKQGFWESIHFVSEFRPGIAIYTIPELDSYVEPSFGFLMGMKVGW